MKKAGEKFKLYFFEGRRTGILARTANEARDQKNRGGDRLVGSRQMTASEEKQAKAGRWVRGYLKPGTRAPDSMRGLGPKPKSFR